MKLLKKLVLSGIVAGSTAVAQVPASRPVCVGGVCPPIYQTIPAPRVPVPAYPPGVVVMPATGVVTLPQQPAGPTLAQRHAETQARTGVMHHSGQFAPGSTREGVGFSTAGPEQAIRASCYWGQCQPTQIGVSRGPNGWYATVQYR
jgi:hypothetical protein